MISKRLIEPLDFTYEIDEPSFYQGVKTQLGHVISGLVIDRPDEIRKIKKLLNENREVLISGPSGAGKSGILWLTTNSFSQNVRWFRVSKANNIDDVDSIVRYIRARRPNELSPIGIAFDEINSTNNDVWDALANEFRRMSSTYLIGSVRQEDLILLVNHTDSYIYSVDLNEHLAEHIWKQLRHKKQTAWQHWREPFEESNGLMLEYTHILTQGRRLSAVINDQVRRLRESENRQIELTLIRSISTICARGGEVDARKLCELLEITSIEASNAFTRLLDEHVIRESSPGIVGGMHTLRTEALHEASHDNVLNIPEDTLWACMLATTIESLPILIQSILTPGDDKVSDERLHQLIETLKKTKDIRFWASVFTGMGFATLNRYVSLFIATMEQHNIQRAHWSMASLFANSSVDIVNSEDFEQWGEIMNAASAFRNTTINDIRFDAIERLPEAIGLPTCSNVEQAMQLLSSLVPLLGREAPALDLNLELDGAVDIDIKEISALISTASMFSEKVVSNLVETFGGEKKLLSQFYDQTPWISEPEFETNGNHGNTIRSNCLFISDDYYEDPNQSIVEICETLIAICPSAEAAASSMVKASGGKIAINGTEFWTKNMPRKNIPIKSSIAWNVAFRKMLLTEAGGISLTSYCSQMAELLRRTEKVIKNYSEKWIARKNISNADSLANEINDIIKATNDLSYAAPEDRSIKEGNGTSEGVVEDNIGALVVGVLGNLIQRMNKVPGEEGIKAVAVFSGGLADDARDYEVSPIWKFTNFDPSRELSNLAERLGDISCVLHELALGDSQHKAQELANIARKGVRGNAIHLASINANVKAERRLNKRIRALKSEMSKKGILIKVVLNNLTDGSNVYWPNQEVTILVHLDNLEEQNAFIDEALVVRFINTFTVRLF